MFPPVRFGQIGASPRRNFVPPFPLEEEEQEPFAPSQPIQQPAQPTDLMSILTELHAKRNGPAMSAYRKFVEQEAPDRETTKPGKLRKLGAILAGTTLAWDNPGAGIRAGQDILDQPFDRAIEKYKLNAGRLSKAAELEETGYKNDVAAVKNITDARDKEADNKRNDLLASSLIAQRQLNMKQTQQAIESNGATFHLDNTTGEGYLVKRDGSKTPVGKFDLSTGEKLANDISKMQEQDRLTGTRQVKLAGINFGNQKALQDDRQSHSIDMQNQGFENQKELVDLRATRAAENAAKKVAKVSTPSDVAKLKSNVIKVQSMFDADPDKYEDLWDGENLGAAPAADDPNYPAFMELYNALYNGFNQLGTTKSGNKIIR